MTHEPTLVLYSGGQSPRNQVLHRELVRLARRRGRGPLRLTYLPFCSDGSQEYFMRSVNRYARHGIAEFCSLAADERPSRAQIREALRADIVYLAGGNTFYFLKALRRSGLLGFLREYAASGGILAGLSAGAHILTPHIGLAGARGLDPDRNDVGLRDLRGLGLTPFEVLPHFRAGARYLAAARRYSAGSRLPFFALPDATGLVVERGAVRVIGRGVRLFISGTDVAVT